MNIDDMIGNTYDLYGADGNCFRLGDSDGAVRTFEAMEDENDGYRSSLDCLRDVTAPDELAKLVFSAVPMAQATGRKATKQPGGYGDTEDDIVELVDTDGHAWLSVGTDNIGDYYPGFVFTWNPKSSE